MILFFLEYYQLLVDLFVCFIYITDKSPARILSNRNGFGTVPSYYIGILDVNHKIHLELHQMLSTLNHVKEAEISPINHFTSIMNIEMVNIGSRGNKSCI